MERGINCYQMLLNVPAESPGPLSTIDNMCAGSSVMSWRGLTLAANCLEVTFVKFCCYAFCMTN